MKSGLRTLFFLQFILLVFYGEVYAKTCWDLALKEKALVLREDLVTPQVGKTYLIQVKGDPDLKKMRFAGMVETNGRLEAEFQDLHGGENSLRRFHEEDVLDWRVDSVVESGLLTAIEFPLKAALFTKVTLFGSQACVS